MNTKKSSKNKIIWLSVLILLICVALTTLAFTDILDVFLPNDNGAISLIPEDTSQTDQSGTDESEPDETESSTTDETQATQSQPTEPEKHPGFEVSDDKAVWGTNTSVEIFKVSYENGEQVITVKSDDGNKVIAPGTENTYTFKLKNTGDVAMDYTVEIDAYFAPADITIPITARICRYDGKWVTGNKDVYSDVSTLNKATDSSTLGRGKFTYYTLDWVWPFESGNDELDTLLGSMANEQDITFTIVIKTTATESDNPNADGGITPPQTGDNSNLTMWIALMFGSLILMLFLILTNEKEKRRYNAEADKS